MCECYQIGGPFIAEDPNCPIHGKGGLWEKEQEARDRDASLEDRIKMLENKVVVLERINKELIKGLSQVFSNQQDSIEVFKGLSSFFKKQMSRKK